MAKYIPLVKTECELYIDEESTLIKLSPNDIKNDNNNICNISPTNSLNVNNLNINEDIPSKYPDNIIQNCIKKWSISTKPPDVSFLVNLIPQNVIEENTKKISTDTFKSISNSSFKRKPTITDCVENKYLIDITLSIVKNYYSYFFFHKIINFNHS